MAAKRKGAASRKPAAKSESTPSAEPASVGETPDTSGALSEKTETAPPDLASMPDLSGDINPPAPPPTVFDNPYGLPPACDVFTVNPDTLERQRLRSADIEVVGVRIWKTAVDGKHGRIAGQFPPHIVSTEWLEGTYGPGTYLCKGINKAGVFVTTGQVTVGITGSSNGGAPSWQAATGAGAVRSGDPLQAMLLKVLEEKVTGSAGDDPIRGAFADMMKMMQMQMQMQMQALQLQMQSKKANEEPANQMMQTLLAAVLKNSGKQAGGGAAEMMQTLQMGLVMGRQLAGNPSADPKEEPEWIKALDITSNAFGAPLVAALAQAALPKDKADAVVDAVNQHLRTREAEANAAASTIDVDGDEVPDLGKTG